jgi:hypothetical protein
MTIKLKALAILSALIGAPFLCFFLVKYFGVYVAYFLFAVSLVLCYMALVKILEEKEEFEKRFIK